MRSAHGIAPDAIERIELRVHPLVMELMGNPAPRTGLEAKLSVHHCAAAAFVFGEVGVKEFTDACATDPQSRPCAPASRRLSTLQLQRTLLMSSVALKDGKKHHAFVPHALGSLERPLTDTELENKFRALAAWGFSTCNAYDVIELLWSFDNINDAAALARTTVPSVTTAV